jgi:hypothetical protein
MSSFEPGDRVVCIEPNDKDQMQDLLIKDNIYVVKHSSNSLVYLWGKPGGYFHFRFTKVSEEREIASQFRHIVL